MTPSEALPDTVALERLFALASAAADDEPIALLDGAGRLIVGRRPDPDTGRALALAQDGHLVGTVVSSASVRPELLALVTSALELQMAATAEHAARARVANELAIGRRIQLALVPRRFPSVPGWTFAAAYEPAQEVGGDLFDAFSLRGRSDRVGLLVADVTGKGIPAALAMADARALLHAATDNATGPGDALERVNRIIVRERVGALPLTVALVVLEPVSGTLRYASAGHEPPLVARSAGGVEPLAAGGPIMGLFDDARYEEHEGRLEPGDALVMYTDGVTDARDRDRRFYGDERLLAAVGQACGRQATAITAAITEDVREFRGDAEPYDDLTLLVVERHAGG